MIAQHFLYLCNWKHFVNFCSESGYEEAWYLCLLIRSWRKAVFFSLSQCRDGLIEGRWWWCVRVRCVHISFFIQFWTTKDDDTPTEELRKGWNSQVLFIFRFIGGISQQETNCLVKRVNDVIICKTKGWLTSL